MCYITVNDISYRHPDREVLFNNIAFSIAKGEKVALVGDNGTGKSTLLRIISGMLRPASGNVAVSEIPYYVPQHFGQFDSMTIAGAVGVENKLNALHAILQGDVSEEHYTALADDWDVENRVYCAMASWGLDGFDAGRPMNTLSGGEKTKVFLSGITVNSPSAILLDEPSNHLDATTRETLYSFIASYKGAMLVVSHDRRLLNLLDRTLELTKEGVVAYGGNYDFYKEQKESALDALKNQVGEKQKAIRVARRTAAEAAQRRQRLDSRGEKKALKEGMPRIMMNTLRNKAETSTTRLKNVHSEKIENMAGELRELRGCIPDADKLKIAFENSGIHRGKMLVSAADVNFGYGKDLLWGKPLNLMVCSGDRIVIRGDNGAGKTTLLKLITGKLESTQGSMEREDFSCLYVDQEYSLVDNGSTVLQQVEKYNVRNLPGHELKTELHRFLFPKETWDKPCGMLSGGEKMKLIFCCLVISNDAPDMFILDEPTNNLDIQSLEIVASALKNYRGTLIVISHDASFVDEIGVTDIVRLGGY